MIDRSRGRLHFCLRPRTLGAVALISAGVFLAVPIAALLSVVAGGFAYAGCVLAMLLLGLAGGVLLIGGGVAIITGLLGGGSETTAGGVAACGVGLAGLAMCDYWNQPVLAAGEAAWTRCCQAAELLMSQVFLGRHVYLWSWSLLAIATTFALTLLAAIGILRFETFVKARLHRIRSTCPACNEPGALQFRCPSCATLASDLAPSPHGIFHAHCGKCQAELPTIDLLGRLALSKVCRYCSAELVHPAIGKQREAHFAIVGAQSSGKTTWMVASLWQVAREFAPTCGLKVEFANNRQKKTLHDIVQGLASGARMAKTASKRRPRAFNVAIYSSKGAGKGPGCLLYLYDAAGEDLTDEGRMSGHRFHRFVDGLFLVIDPFAEAIARSGRSGGMDRETSKVHPATAEVAAVMEPFMSRLEQQLNVSAESVFSIPVAVVVGKMEPMSHGPWSSMAERLGPTAGVNSYREGVRGTANVGEKPSSPVRAFLLDLGLANLVLGLETRFRKVAYFATSAVEEIPTANRRPAPRRAAVPLLWLIQQTGALPAVWPKRG
ncbi:MAG: hypothetical protein ACQESR_03855 [Planctomycetota bacterium]